MNDLVEKPPVEAPPPPIDNGDTPPPKPVVQEEEVETPSVEVPEPEEEDNTPPPAQVYHQLELPVPPEDEYDQAAMLAYQLDMREARQEALDQILSDVRKLGVPEDVLLDYRKKLKGASAEALVAFHNTGSHLNDAYAYLYRQSQQAPKKTVKPAPKAPTPTPTAVTPPEATPQSKLTAKDREAIATIASTLGADPKDVEANYLKRAGK